MCLRRVVVAHVKTRSWSPLREAVVKILGSEELCWREMKLVKE